MLDIATAFIFAEVLTVVNAITAFLLWRAYRDLHGLAAISAGVLVLTAAFALMGFRTTHMITVCNAALVLAIGLTTDGMVALVGGKRRLSLVFGLTAFTVLFWEWSQWLDAENMVVRVVAATLIYYVLYGRLLVEVARNRGQVNVARVFMIFTLVAHLAVLTGRMITAILHPDPSFIFSARFLPWFLLEGAVVLMLTFFFVMLMAGAQLDAVLKQRTLSLASERHMHAQLRQFLSMLGHELRTPLTVIDRAAEIGSELLDPVQPPVKRRLDTIRSTVDRLRSLMDNLLMAERVELEVSDATLVDVARLVHDLMRLLAHKYADGRIIATLVESPALVRGNREMLAAAIGNLLDNSLKFSPPDQLVHIDVRHGGGGVTITVSDKGIGFPLHQISQIGQRFFRADNAQTVQGTGLGLNIVKTIIEKHKGRLVFDNAMDGGATVVVTLPCVAAGPQGPIG